MKKLFAILLALMLVLASVAALADEPAAAYSPSAAFEFEPIPKNYYKELPEGDGEGTPAVVFPAETLTFEVTADTANPDKGKNNVEVGELEIEGVSDNMIKVKVPALPEPGLYHFTIKEVAGDTQGVTYSGTSTELKISVLVIFDETDPTKLVVPKDGYGVTAVGENKEKVDEIANQYEVANLTITKAVSGNLGNKNRSFPVDVTFTATDNVRSDITITGEFENKVETIAAPWTGEKKVTVYVKDKSEIVFQNIPLNVTYTVVENKEATQHLDAASDEPNNLDAYKVSGETEGAVTLTEDAKVELKNEKNIEIDTGVSMATVPYIMILALVLIGAAMMIIRKREEY